MPTTEEKASRLRCGCCHIPEGNGLWVLCSTHRTFLGKDKISNKGYQHRIIENKKHIEALRPSLSSGYIRDPEAPQRHYWLYALLLNKNKFYIGLTTNKNPYNRINMHGHFMGAAWTRKYKPIKILEIRDVGSMTKEEAENQENDLTLAYMNTYGIRNVRGGRMTNTGWIFRKKRNPTALSDLLTTVFTVGAILGFIAIYLYAMFYL